MKITILNKVWNTLELELTARTTIVKNLITEYKKDSNCRAYDFIVNEDISELEKAAFIYEWVNSPL